jgi:hypothetical protein
MEDDVELEVLPDDGTHDRSGFDALVTLGAPPPPMIGARAERVGGDPPLLVVLAPSASGGEHVRMLEREADLVLPALTHGRVVLATVLALLRWRARR